MTQLNFTETELAELQTFYQQKLEKTLQRLEDIKAILNKLDQASNNTGTTDLNASQPVKASKPEKATKALKESKTLKATKTTSEKPSPAIKAPTTKRKTKAKRKTKSKVSPIGRKIGRWPAFILDTLKASEKPLKIGELLPLALGHFKLEGEEEQIRADRNLRGHLFRMIKRGEIGSTKVSGQRENLYSYVIGLKKPTKLDNNKA